MAPAERFTWTVDPTVSKASDVQSSVKTAKAVFLGFMTTYDESLRTPKAKDWSSVMKKYASKDALSIWTNAWTSVQKYGGHRAGTTSAVGRVTAAGSTGVQLRACMNISKQDDRDKDGKVVELATGAPEKNFAWLMTIQGGKVIGIAAQTATGKWFSC